MSTLTAIGHVKKALTNLNPAAVRQDAARTLNVALVSNSPEGLWKMERYFCPPELSFWLMRDFFAGKSARSEPFLRFLGQ